MKYIAVILAANIITGCATVTRGSNQAVPFNSTPQKASVEVSGQRCITPCGLKLKRSQTHKVMMSKAGYRDAGTVLTPSIEGAGVAGLAGNVLVGGVIGMGVDAASGAMYTLNPQTVHLNLDRK